MAENCKNLGISTLREKKMLINLISRKSISKTLWLRLNNLKQIKNNLDFEPSLGSLCSNLQHRRIFTMTESDKVARRFQHFNRRKGN